MTQQSRVGNFTQLPNVLFDSCDIADEAIMMFARLYRQVAHRGGVFQGSIRKLASAVNLKRDKAHRNLKVLETSGLVLTGLAQDVDVSAIELNTEQLWELNTYANNGVAIPRWKNLKTVLEAVRKIGQEAQTDDNEIDETVLETGQAVANIGQTVRTSVLRVPPNKKNKIKYNTNTKSNTNSDESPSSIPASSSQKVKTPKSKNLTPPTKAAPQQAILELPPQEKKCATEGGNIIWQNWIALPKFSRRKPSITDKAIEWCDSYAKDGCHEWLTTEIMKEIIDFAKKRDPKYYGGMPFSLGHFNTEISKWSEYQEDQKHAKDAPAKSANPLAEEREDDGYEWWTTEPNADIFGPKCMQQWRSFKWMLREDAIHKYKFNEPIMPRFRNEMIRRQRDEHIYEPKPSEMFILASLAS